MNAENPLTPSRWIWPSIVPLLAFLILLEVSARTPADWSLGMLVARVTIPLGILVALAMRGAYGEVRVRLAAMTLVDLALGVLLAVLWIAPFVIIPGLRPKADSSPFDPLMAGATWVPIVLALRMLGYAVVTPWLEELFMRSFLMRYADVYDTDDNFHDVPVGRFTWRSFFVVTIVFLITHQMWEWPVMLPWAVLTNLWFYYRKDLFALMVVHAATNGTILLSAIAVDEGWLDLNRQLPSLWFLV